MIRHLIRNADGEVIAATCTDGPLSAETEAALVALAEASRRLSAERDADGALSARQAQARTRNRERLERLRAGRHPDDPDKGGDEE